MLKEQTCYDCAHARSLEIEPGAYKLCNKVDCNQQASGRRLSMVVIQLAGKARNIFRFLSLLAKFKGDKTLKELQ